MLTATPHGCLSLSSHLGMWIPVPISQNYAKWFAIYGVPQEISTNGGSPYTCHEVLAFLNTWGVSHRLSSAHYPQSSKAEGYEKLPNGYWMSSYGCLETESFACSLLQHKNSSLLEIELLCAKTMRCRPTLAPTHNRDTHAKYLNRELVNVWVKYLV